MKRQYASITKKLAFTIDQLANVIFEIKNVNLVGIKSEIQLLLTGKTYRGSVKVIDKTFKKYKDYMGEPGENITILQELNGRKCSIHLGKNNPHNWMPKMIQARLKREGKLPPDHIIE